jgi:hypothetical protein
MDETGCQHRITICDARGGKLSCVVARLRSAPRRGRSLTIVVRDDAAPQ